MLDYFRTAVNIFTFLSVTRSGDQLLNFTPVTTSTLDWASHDIQSHPAEVLQVTVRCTNGAGLTSTGFTDGVRLLEEPPATDHVTLDVLTSSQTQYPTRGYYHGDPTRLKFRWKDFNMYQNISSYIVSHCIAVKIK